MNNHRNTSLLLLLAFALSAISAHSAFANANIISKKKAILKNTKLDNKVIFRNWGLENSIAHSHIDIQKAWKISKGSADVVVAVIDTGVDAEHESLKKSIWYKKDSNEYGYDFVNSRINPKDNNGHGTHIAGIIAASQNENGISGVAPGAKIMALRYYADNLSGAKQIANTVKAIDYAIKNDAKVINFSANGALPADEERAAIERAQEKGIIFVAASGNQGFNTDISGRHSYPANYNLPNVISVSSHNIRGDLSSFSNYGKNSIFISAPGEQIFSTLPNSRFGYMSGTSQATAFVSGVVALMLSINPSLKAKDIKELLKKSISPGSALAEMQEKISSGGMLNAERSLAAVKSLLNQNRTVAAETKVSSSYF